MITFQFAEASHIPQLTALWCDVWGDSPEYVQQFYAHWYGKGIILIALDGEQVVGMGHLLPASLILRRKSRPAYYYYACAVKEQYRSQGIFSRMNETVQSICQKERAYIAVLPETAALFGYYERFGFQPVPLYHCITAERRDSAQRQTLPMQELTADLYSKLLTRSCEGIRCTMQWDTDALEYVIREIRFCGGFAKQFEADGVCCAVLGSCEDRTLHIQSLAAPEALRETLMQQLMQHFTCDTAICRVPESPDAETRMGMVLKPDGENPKEIFFPHDLT